MSKHLRFKNLLGMLAIMLTLGMSWGSVSAQNTSSDKEVASFAVAGQVGTATIDNTLRTIGVTVPYGSVATLATTFQVSTFAQMYLGMVPAGGFGTATQMASGTSYDYTTAMTTPSTFYVTVEAENHSFVYYLVTVSTVAPSTAADLLTVQLDYLKSYVLCGVKTTAAKTATTSWAGGLPVALATEANANLDAVTLYFTMSGMTATLNGVAVTTGSAHDFDADNNGVAEAQTLVITAQDGSTTKTYTVTVVQALPSIADALLTFTYDPSLAAQPAGFTQLVSLNKNDATNVIDVVVNYMGTTPDFSLLIPTFTMSTYATATSTAWVGGPVAAQTAEVCSSVTALGGATVQLLVYGEDRTEVSTWTINITQATARTGNTLLGLNVDYVGTWGCSVTGNFGPIAGTIAGSTVTFSVPMGVTSVTIDAATAPATNPTLSDGATSVPSSGALTTGSTVVVTSEAGVAKTYTVALVEDGGSSQNSLLTFGFEADDNTGTGITVDVAGTITGGLVNVIVPWNTDLYSLVAYFTASDFTSVFIAESDGSYTQQCTEVTANDFSNSQTYVVRAQDGTEERWDVSVTKEAVKTGNAIVDFMLLDLPMCIGPDASVTASADGMALTLTVKNGTVVTALDYSFTISDGASADMALTGTADFTSAKTINVTAQNGDVATYTVTVVVRSTTMNSVAKINKYWFESLNAQGEINETAKTIHVWVPWGTSITNLVASFELENAAWTRMTRSEDLITSPELMQTSGVSSNDYTTPIAYTVYGENCATVEYFVTVFVTPNTDTGISAFEFCYTDCGCDLGTKIDPFAKRIYVTVPSTVSIKSLAPCKLTIHPEAKISPAWDKAQDWTKGPVTYTVTAPDGVTKSTWEVLVSNPPCQETDILSFALPQIQVAASDLNSKYNEHVVTIDKVNHTIDVIIKKGSKLDKVYYDRTISCGATICCVSGNCIDNQYLDFSENLCHTCVVTAQDESITQEWTICLIEVDTDCPEVTTESVLAMNYQDTVYASTTELGEIFIIHEDAIACIDNYYPCNCDFDNPLGDPALIAKFRAEKMLSKVSADTVGAPIAIPTNGLYSGVYYAFAIDAWGHVSCQSKQKLYIDIHEMDVATLSDLRSADPAYMYTLTSEVVVTYEETITGGNLKYVQHADNSAGIEIRDLNAGCAKTYGIGAGLTGLRGMIMNSNHLSGNDPCSAEKSCTLVFVPICCYSPTVSSTGNVIAPILMTYGEFAAATHANESMLVRITTPIQVWNDYTGATAWNYDADRVNADLYTWNSLGDVDYLVSSVLNTNYIGEEFPDVPKIFQGINTNYIYGGTCYGSITPRWVAKKKGDPSDILEVGDCKLFADPSPVLIAGVAPGSCSALTDVTIINEGANKVTITALYLDDKSGQDEFELIYPTPVPFDLDHWVNATSSPYMETVQVKFCPKDPGSEEATLVVEYCDGTILEIPINGTTITTLDMPYCTSFEDNGSDRNDWVVDGGTDGAFGFRGWRVVTGKSVAAFWGSANKSYTTPAFRVTGLDPVLQYFEGKIYNGDGNMSRQIKVSEDFGKTWTVVSDYKNSTIPEVYFAANPFKKRTVSLSAFVGKTVLIRFNYVSVPNWSYWLIEDVCVQERVTTPLYGGAAEIAYGGVQVGETATSTYTVTNMGVSVLNVTKVELTGGADFAITDANVYPVEVTSDNMAFAVAGGAASVSFDVSFSPSDVGVQNAVLRVTYGLYADHVVEIPVSGDGLSCSTAAEAVLGENVGGPNTWFTYTAAEFQIAYITSCDPRNTVDPYAYSYDTYLSIYADCEGTLIGENDDLEWDACPSNRASSGLLLPLNEGETIKIFWDGIFMNECATCALPFFFHITATYPIDGDVCETAIPLTLPVVNHFGTTVGFEDDYDMSPCSPYSNYMDGNDKVYSINLETEGYLTGNILGAYGSIHVLDACPKEELTKDHCKAFKGGPNGGEFTKRISAGEYYVIISTWAPPQTVDYLLNMSFEEGSGIDDSNLSSNLVVYPNPTSGKFTVSISNAEATDLTVELVNISGQVVYSNNVKAVYSYNEDIDASEFAKGVYYLKVNDGSEVKVEKVVVQ